MAEDIAGLETTLGREWKLNQPFKFTADGDDHLAIDLAIVENKQRVVDYLIEKRANLNVRSSPAILCAVESADAATIERLLDAGARIDAVNNGGSNAYSRALYSNRFDLLPFLLAKGLRVDADGGVSFRQAVSNRQREAVEFFLKAGIDPDLQTPDMVFPFAPTAVQVAARNDDFDMVRLLVDHGADVTLADAFGERPFLEAVSNKNVVLQSYLGSLEPSAWHDPQRKIALLQSFGVTDDLIEFLQHKDRRVYVNSKHCTWLDFHHLLNVRELGWSGGPYLVLLADRDYHCACGWIAWSKRKRRLVAIDEEHDEVTMLGSWREFVADPEASLSKQYG
jgi:hypothetical protein